MIKLPEYDEQGVAYPWKDESDFAYYTDKNTGLDYFISRHPIFNVLCGYLILEESDVELFPYEMINNECTEIFELDKPISIIRYESGFFSNSPKCCISFHCGHLGDAVPYTEHRLNYKFGGEIYRDIKYVQNECKKLAAQVADLLKLRK